MPPQIPSFFSFRLRHFPLLSSQPGYFPDSDLDGSSSRHQQDLCAICISQSSRQAMARLAIGMQGAIFGLYFPLYGVSFWTAAQELLEANTWGKLSPGSHTRSTVPDARQWRTVSHINRRYLHAWRFITEANLHCYLRWGSGSPCIPADSTGSRPATINRTITRRQAFRFSFALCI